MKLSDGEKLIILMLSDLHEKLDINGEIEPYFLKSAIFNDHLWGIRWKYSGIPFEDSEDPTIVKEVADILDMWSFIERGYSKLNEKDKETLSNNVEFFGKNPKFEGFDGNNESEYMSTAMFLVNDLDRFTEFKGRSFNCHHHSIGMHKRMLEKFMPIRKQLSHEPLTVDQLTEILRAKAHPAGSGA